MKCPNCGKDVSDGQSYCNACGSVLYGPRNVNLKNPGKAVGSEQSNDISSITGIDINSLSHDIGEYDTMGFLDEPENVKRARESKKVSKNKIGTFILVGVIVCLTGLSTYLFISNYNLKKDGTSVECNTSTLDKETDVDTTCAGVLTKEYVTGYYALAGYYAFQIPTGWRYSEVTGGSAITDDNISILLLDYAEVSYSEINQNKLLTSYITQGFTTATAEEITMGSNKVIAVSYFASNIYFTDFYMDYNGESIIYGQVSAPIENAINTEAVTSILSSIIVQEQKNSIKIMKAPIDFEKVITSASGKENA